MSLSSSKPFWISLSDIEKVRCYSACCRGQVIVEDHCEFEERTDKEDSLDFLSDYYFDTKSPVAFTSPLTLYREAKKHYLFLAFSVKLKLGYNPKTPTHFINQFGIIFRETESLLRELMISCKQIWWT